MWKSYSKIKLIAILKSKKLVDQRIEVKNKLINSILCKQLYKHSCLSVSRMAILIKSWKKRTYMWKLINAISLIIRRLQMLRIRKNHILQSQMAFRDITYMYIKNKIINFLKDKDRVYTQMKYKVKTLKFSNALLNKESFRFLNQLRRSLYLNRGLTYLIKQNEKRDHNTLQKYNLMWVKIANLDLSSKNDMKYFLKEIIKSQCFFFIYQIKINAGKVLKLNETVDKIHRKLALYRKLDSWYLFMR